MGNKQTNSKSKQNQNKTKTSSNKPQPSSTSNTNEEICDAQLLLFNVDNKTLEHNQQKIIDSLGGFRLLLNAALSSDPLTIDSTQMDSFSVYLSSKWDPTISPFINKSVDILCDLVTQFSWSVQHEFKPKDLEETIANIIFSYAAIYNIWVIPEDIAKCEENKIEFVNRKVQLNIGSAYHTAFVCGFKIDPNITGKYSCSMISNNVVCEKYFGIIEAEKGELSNNNTFNTCIGYLELNDGYCYCFNRGGFYHQENRNPIGGPYNQRYSMNVIQNINDIMTVYVNVKSGNKGILDWGINGTIIGNGNSLEIEIPKDGLYFAVSAGNWKNVGFQVTEIVTPKRTFTFE